MTAATTDHATALSMGVATLTVHVPSRCHSNSHYPKPPFSHVPGRYHLSHLFSACSVCEVFQLSGVGDSPTIFVLAM